MTIWGSNVPALCSKAYAAITIAPCPILLWRTSHGPRRLSQECSSLFFYADGFRNPFFNLIGHSGKRPNQAGAAIEGGESGEAGRNHSNGSAGDDGGK